MMNNKRNRMNENIGRKKKGKKTGEKMTPEKAAEKKSINAHST